MITFTRRSVYLQLTFEYIWYDSNYRHLTFLKPLLFQMRPARQLVRQTMAAGVTGFPAILVRLLTRLGYRWYPEFSIYEDIGEFNQERYQAVVRIYDRQDRSITELHTFHGVGVTVDMAVHDAAYAALTRLRGDRRHLDDSEFRYIPYPPAESETGYYTAVCTPYSHRRYDPQVLI